MIDSPPSAEGTTAAPGWYPDPETPGVLRWWDGDEWSATDIKPDGVDGYPAWHPMYVRQAFRSALETLFIKVAARTWWR
jgi:hypothetical protein